MAYEITTKILNDFLQSSQSILEFHHDISHHLLKVLETQKIDLDDSREDIRRALVDFFNTQGMSALILFQKNHHLKITTHIKNRHHNLYTHFLILWLKEQNHKELTPEFFADISEYAKNHFTFDDELLRRDIIRGALREYYKIDLRDSLFFKNFELFLKKFDYDFVQINKELRSIKKLDTSILLTQNDQNYINQSLQHINLKKCLITAAQDTLENKINFSTIKHQEICKLYCNFVTQNLRIQIGNILGKSIPSLNQTCFAEEYTRSHKSVIAPILATKILELAYQQNHNISTFFHLYKHQIKNNNPKLKKQIPDSQNYYTAIMIDRISEDFFDIQKQTQTIDNKIQELQIELAQYDQCINNTKEEIKNKNLILNELTAIYEQKKHSIKNKNLSKIDQETLDNSLAHFTQEQKTLLEELDTLAKDINEMHAKKSVLMAEKNDLERDVQQIHFIHQTQEKDFHLLAQSFGEVLL